MQSQSLGHRRLVMVSNRLPFSVAEKDGIREFRETTGGLVTGLASYLSSMGSDPDVPAEFVWVGWPGATIGPDAMQEVTERAMKDYQSVPVFLSEQEMDHFYHGFCNKTIWPLFHYFPSLTVYQEEYWQEYVRVNQLFCDALMAVVGQGDIVWIHDYHLMVLPGMLRERLPSVSLGFFLHIPFPSFEVFRLLPAKWRREILSGLLGADLVGFHTYDYTQHFLQSVLRILGHDNNLGVIALPDRILKVDTFPMGIDFARFDAGARAPTSRTEQDSLRNQLEGKRVVLSVDRLDYTKGILNRLRAFETLLAANPEYRGNVVLVMVVVPSRIMVDQYEAMKREIESYVGLVNGRFGTIGWTPVLYQYRYLPFEPLVAFYAMCDIGLVTPLRDGMNLVAKEYVAARTNEDGVLILSEMAGAVKELGEAIVINPNNREEIAAALKEAIEMPKEEQRRRMQIMRSRLQRYTVRRWATDFVHQVQSTCAAQAAYLVKLLSSPARRTMLKEYEEAKRRLLLLDYDGTLVPFSRRPMLAVPPAEVLAVLEALAQRSKNTVVVVSGRDRGILDRWLGNLPVHLVAEHGMWVREFGTNWQMPKAQSADWKPKLLPILEWYADKLPGAFVEEKDFSLVWHYRTADPEQSEILLGELKDHLVSFTANIDLQILQGSKVIEIRNSGVNKGVGALQWLHRESFDFILAVGDDWTDEDLFAVLPDTAWSLKVGVQSTRARYNLRESREVLRLLESLLSVEPEATLRVPFPRTTTRQ